MSARVDPIKCPFCLSPKLFKSPSKLYIHLREHTSERPFLCSQPNCGKRFRIKSDLKPHLLSHHQRLKKMSTKIINNVVPSTSTSGVKLEGTKSNNRPSTISDQESTVSQDNEGWKTPKIGTISPTSKPTGTGLNFVPSSVWFQCQICRVLMEHEDKFLIHKRKKHRLPKRISPPVESDAESDKSVQIIAVVSKATKKVPFVNLEEDDEPPEKKPFVANLWP